MSSGRKIYAISMPIDGHIPSLFPGSEIEHGIESSISL
jgi:hypothetical protein